MRKIIAGTLFMALTGTLAVAAPRQDRDDRRNQVDEADFHVWVRTGLTSARFGRQRRR